MIHLPRIKNIVMDNMVPSDTGIRLGEKQIRCLSLIDIDRIDLPEKVSPYIRRSDNEAIKGFPVDTMLFYTRCLVTTQLFTTRSSKYLSKCKRSKSFSLNKS
jgi:hypothetical protein